MVDDLHTIIDEPNFSIESIDDGSIILNKKKAELEVYKQAIFCIQNETEGTEFIVQFLQDLQKVESPDEPRVFEEQKSKKRKKGQKKGEEVRREFDQDEYNQYKERLQYEIYIHNFRRDYKIEYKKIKREREK